jgi:hypothetical protein
MAIFKKIFIVENSSQNQKISTNTITSITPNSAAGCKTQPSSCSSNNESTSLNGEVIVEEEIPENIRDFWYFL